MQIFMSFPNHGSLGTAVNITIIPTKTQLPLDASKFHSYSTNVWSKRQSNQIKMQLKKRLSKTRKQKPKHNRPTDIVRSKLCELGMQQRKAREAKGSSQNEDGFEEFMIRDYYVLLDKNVKFSLS